MRAGIDNGRGFGIEIDRQQDPRRSVTHRQDGRKHQSRDIGEPAPDGFGFQAGLCCGAFKQRRGQLAVKDRQAGEQCFAADRPAVMGRKELQRVSQRIARGRGGGAAVVGCRPRFRGACMVASAVKALFLVHPAKAALESVRLSSFYGNI